MSVRVNKSSFSIREKLSELERPIGLKGSELMRAETAQEARDFVSAGRKNMVINGDMRVFQRGNSGNVPNTGTYFLDRFQSRNNTAGTLYITQQSSAAGPPGFRSWLIAQCDGADTSVASNDYARIQHYIEGYNCSMDWGYGNTDYVTASFWVKSNKTGTYCFQIEDGDALPLYCQEYVIEQSNVWQKVVLTIPPPKEGTWRGADSGIGARLTWTLMAGSGHPTTANVWQTGYGMRTSNQVNFMDDVNNNFYLTGVQLEVGRNATEFEYRPYGEELALCQRYYEKLSADCGNGGFATLMMASKNSNTLIVGQPIFRVPKRAVGATFSHGGNLRMYNAATGSDITISSVQNSQLGTHGGYIVLVISNNTISNGDGFRVEGSNDTSAFIAFASEL